MAMMLTMLFSMLFFSFSPSLEFGCGLTVLIISMYIYHHPLANADTIPSTKGVTESCDSASDSCSTELGRPTKHNEKKRVTFDLRQNDDFDDSATSSITITSSGSLSSKTPKIPMRGLQLKKTQYSILPGESENLPSTRANVKTMDLSLHTSNETHT
ncbi:unnamed protein product [Peronospora belbahrii]|nr:unnamed protein product [Peronospora belbahrii]